MSPAHALLRGTRGHPRLQGLGRRTGTAQSQRGRSAPQLQRQSPEPAGRDALRRGRQPDGPLACQQGWPAVSLLRLEAGDGKSPDADTGWRLPAPAIEDVVLDGIRSFLCDRLRLTEALHLTGGRMKGKLAEASRLNNWILEAGPADQRCFLLEVVKRIEVRRDRVSIILRTQTLRAMLSHGHPEKEQANTETRGKDEYRLDLPVTFRRRGVEIKLVITDERERPPAPDPHLIAAVAQGRHWFAQIRGGDVQSVRDLAERQGVNQGDVSRILPLGLLAPDIVEAILAGRQPIELTAKRLKRIRDLPVSWAEQRRLLGFA